MAWAGAVRVGVGIAYAHHQTWIVAQYSPAEQGSLSYNVFPPIQGWFSSILTLEVELLSSLYRNIR